MPRSRSWCPCRGDFFQLVVPQLFAFSTPALHEVSFEEWVILRRRYGHGDFADHCPFHPVLFLLK